MLLKGRSWACQTRLQSSAKHAPPQQIRRVHQVQRRIVVRASNIHGDNGEIIDKEDKAKLDLLLERFQMADADGNGVIDRDELRALLESTEGGRAMPLFTEHWLPEDELDRIMQQYDTNNNGTIEFEEFRQIILDGLLLDGMLSEYRAAFDAVDSSGNGTIGATELAKMLTDMGNPISFEQLVDIMQKYDKDESGQIEFHEFLLMFRDHMIDLKEVQNYLESKPSDLEGKGPSNALLDTLHGDITLIFSEQELDEVIAASQGKLVVLYCAMTWCRPCKAMQRPAQRMASAYKDTMTWIKIFGNANEQTKSIMKNRLKVRSTPCFVVFKDGEVVHTQTGTKKERLEAALRELVHDKDKIPAWPLYH